MERAASLNKLAIMREVGEFCKSSEKQVAHHLCGNRVNQEVRLWKFDPAAFQSRSNKDFLAVWVDPRNPNS
jgi:hypothetical protein